MAWYFVAIISAVTAVATIGLFIAVAFAWEKLFGAKKTLDSVRDVLRRHFEPHPITELAVDERNFPFHVRADLYRTLDAFMRNHFDVIAFNGLTQETTFSHCFVESAYDSGPTIGPTQYEELDIGEEETVPCLKNGLWLVRSKAGNHAVLLGAFGRALEPPSVRIQVASLNEPKARAHAQGFFQSLDEAIKSSQSYRGKVLSLEQEAQLYSGKSTGIKVHRLRKIERDEVILPTKTLELLERNVVHFVQRRAELARFRQPTKKGLLFYGPPGTGKTHTIHFLTRELPEHTTFLITSEQVGLLDEYMTLARLLQPSLVVIEDADLIARDRAQMGTCEEVLLNKLLNEMDGLREEASILFILTTNRPEMLEPALASRPGRIDQAIEFPLPDDVGRRKLVRLYSQGIAVSDEVVDELVRRTDRVSAAFIKELMRRSAQFHLERNGTCELTRADIDSALDEMLFDGGTLNLKLLGAAAATA